MSYVAPEDNEKNSKRTSNLYFYVVTQMTFDVGAKLWADLQEFAGTRSCELPHVAFVLSSTIRIVMDDGSIEDFSAGDAMLLPPGHDAWTVGDEPCTFVEFSRGNDYYAGGAEDAAVANASD